MAEVTGLVVGTIGLAALFQTCIELFERFELGRNHSQDYQLACTKIDLLQARLRQWGEQFQVGVPGLEHPALRRNWTDEQAVIARSLIGIKAIFERASSLVGKYEISSSASSTLLLREAGQTCSKDSDSGAKASKPHSRLSMFATAGKRTTWAIRDKSRFDNFIEDLSFLMDNLEKVGARITMSSAKTAIPRKSVPRQFQTEPEKACRSDMSTSKATAGEPRNDTSKTAAPRAKVLTKDERAVVINMISPKEVHAHFGRSLINKRGVMAVGNVGKSSTCQITDGEIVENEDGVVVLGNIRSGKDLGRVVLANKGMIVSEAEMSDSSADSDSASETLRGRLSRIEPYRKRLS